MVQNVKSVETVGKYLKRGEKKKFQKLDVKSVETVEKYLKRGVKKSFKN